MPEDGWTNLYRVGGFAFSLGGRDPQLRQLADAVYSGARAAQGEAGVRFELAARRRPHGACVYTMSCAGVEVCRQTSLDDFFLDVEWALTHRAMASLPTLLQVHAGVVASGDAGILICGPPESGKTSLVVGLADRGAAVLTDEIGLLQVAPRRPGGAAVDLVAFPRDLIVHARTQTLFPHSAYADQPGFKRFADRCYVPPCQLTSAPPRARAPLRLLLFPAFAPGRGLAAARLGPAEAARRLLRNAYNLESLGEAGPELVAQVAESCPAWSLRYADAARASPAFMTLIGGNDRGG